MKVIEVLPLSKGVFRESLSYFTADESVKIGSIVSVPVRGKEINALVANIFDPTEAKADLKSSAFSLKKIGKLKSKDLLFPAFIKAAEDTARYFATSTGAILATFTSKIILDSPQPIVIAISSKENESGKRVRETLVFQAEDEERFSTYKSLVRERFARGLSVYLCVATNKEAGELSALFDRGIGEYSFLLHGGLPKLKIMKVWKNALLEKHPILIVGTAAFLSIPRADLGTIILEHEGSRFYKSAKRPYADTRIFIEFLSKRMGLELIMADTALRVETIYKSENGQYAEFGSTLKFRSLWGGAYRIVDMRPSQESEKKEKFQILSNDLKKIINNLSINNEKLFIFTSRRGLSPLTVCGDCGTVVNCGRCGAPITLHRGGTHTFFLCHHCGEKRDTEERCRICNSWKLETLGIGIELVEKTIEKEFPNLKLLRLDKDTANTSKKAIDIVNRFYENKSGILLGTEIAIYYLREKIENSAIVSIDSLFSLPDFRINERIFSMLLSIRAKTEKRLIIQTRNIEASVIGYAATGSIGDFYREEIKIRKQFQYPPFSVLIKISFEGSKEAVEKQSAIIESLFEGFMPQIFPAFISTPKGKQIINALIKVPRESWPDDVLIEKLKQLPPFYSIEVDPESML